METKKFKTVEEYFTAFPKETRNILEGLRKIIKETAPGAEEVISYNMPAFKFHGMLVFYAVCKNHIGFYPTPSAIKVFSDELAAYETSKGAIQFPIEKAIPAALVKKIVKFRVKENMEKASAKISQKKIKVYRVLYNK